MRFHHSTRRGRTRHSSGHGSGAASSNSHGSSAAAARWALNYCRETNIHFNRRLPVEPPAEIAGGRGAAAASSNYEDGLDDIWNSIGPIANTLNVGAGDADDDDDCYGASAVATDLVEATAAVADPTTITLQNNHNSNHHNHQHHHRLEINSDLQQRMHFLRVREDCDGDDDELVDANSITQQQQMKKHQRIKSQPNSFEILGAAATTTTDQDDDTATQMDDEENRGSAIGRKQQQQQSVGNHCKIANDNLDHKLPTSRTRTTSAGENIPKKQSLRDMQRTTASGPLDMESIRERLVSQVRKHPFWSNKAAKRMNLDFVERRRIYIYELVSFCERRQLEYRYEPYRGGLVQSVPFASSTQSPNSTPSHQQHLRVSGGQISSRPCSPSMARRLNRPEMIQIPRSLPGSPSASIDHGNLQSSLGCEFQCSNGQAAAANANVNSQTRAASCQPTQQIGGLTTMTTLMEESGQLVNQHNSNNIQSSRQLVINRLGMDSATASAGRHMSPGLLGARNPMARSNSATTSAATYPSGMIVVGDGDDLSPNLDLNNDNSPKNNTATLYSNPNNHDRNNSMILRSRLNYSNEANYDASVAAPPPTTLLNDDAACSTLTPIGAIQRSMPSPEFVWSLPLEPKTLKPSPFKGYEHSSELPNSSFVKRCHGCQGKGRLKCKSCHGVGYEVCLSCYGKGTTRNLHSTSASSSSRYRDSSSAGYDGRGGGGGGIVGGGAGISGSGGGINLASGLGDSTSDSRSSRNDAYWSSSSGGGAGGATSSYLESCHMCHGAGQKRCWACAGSSYKFCPGCLGAGRLRCYQMLHIIFLNHRDESFLNNSDEIIPKDRLRLVSGKCVLDETAEELKALTSGRLIKVLEASSNGLNDDDVNGNNDLLVIDKNNPKKRPPATITKQPCLEVGSLNKLDEICLLQTTSDKLMKKHREIYRNERLIRQRHTITQIEADVVSYEWKRRSGKFAIYGDERKVYIAKYPYKSICNIT